MSTTTSLDLYTEHFGLSERPFSLVPDPDFLFWSPNHLRAYAMLEYGIFTRAPITVITGDVGAGKTTLLQHLLRSVGDDVNIGLVSNAQGDRGDLLRWVLLALSLPALPGADYVDLFGQFQAYLISQYAAGHRTILIFDEAQNLPRESLEELRMMTNINSGKDDLLQLVLIGQPELRTMIHRPDLTQFAQRVAASFHLTAMTPQMVRAYIHHRMLVAGSESSIFSPAASDAICAATGGVPRLVNQLCDLSLVYAYSKNQKRVMRLSVEQVLEDGVFFAGGAQIDRPAVSEIQKMAN